MPEEKTSMSLPPNWSGDPLSEHMGIAIGNLLSTFAHIETWNEFLVGVDSDFSTIYQNLPDNELSAMCDDWPNPWNNLQYSQALWPKIFMVRAHSGYRAACQLAMSGQTTESTPILRLCLEHSLYALHMNKNQKALDTWNKQYGGYALEKPISRIFCMGKLKRTLRKMDEKTNLSLHPFVDELYQMIINLGGHPNKLAIDFNLEPTPGDNETKIKLLHNNPEFIKASMGLVAKVGMTCLVLFRIIFPKQFEENGISKHTDLFEQDIPRQHEHIKEFNASILNNF